MIAFHHFLDMSLFELSCELQRGVSIQERDGVLEDAIMLVWARSDEMCGSWS